MSAQSNNPYSNVLKSKGASPVIEASKDTKNAREETTPKQPAFASVKLRSIGDKSPVAEEIAKASLSPATSVGSETPKTPAFAAVKLRSVGGSAYSTPLTSDSQKASEQNVSTGKDILSTGSKKESSETARLSRTSGNKLAAFLNAAEGSPSSPSVDNTMSVEASKSPSIVKETAQETPSVLPKPTISTPTSITVSSNTPIVADLKKTPSSPFADIKKNESPSYSGSATVSPFGVTLKSMGAKPADFVATPSTGSGLKPKVEPTPLQINAPEKATPSSSSSASAPPFQVKLRSVGSKPADFSMPSSASKVEVASPVTIPPVDDEKRSPVVVAVGRTPVTVSSASKTPSTSASAARDPVAEKSTTPFPIKLRSVADKPADFVEGPTSSVIASKAQKEETGNSPFANIKLRSAGEKPADFTPEVPSKSIPQVTPEPEKNEQQPSPAPSSSKSSKSPFAAFVSSTSSENKPPGPKLSESPSNAVPQPTVVAKPVVAKVEKSPVEKLVKAEPTDATKSPFSISLRPVAEKPADFTEGPTSKISASKTKPEDVAMSPVFTAVKLRSTSDVDLSSKPSSPKGDAPEPPAFAAVKLRSTSEADTTSKPVAPKENAAESPVFAEIKLRSVSDVDLAGGASPKETVGSPAFAEVKLRSTSDADKSKSVESSRDGNQSPSSTFAVKLRSVNDAPLEQASNKETIVNTHLSAKLRSNSDAKQSMENPDLNEATSNPPSPSSASTVRSPTQHAKGITATESESNPFAQFLSQPSTITPSPSINPPEVTPSAQSFSLGSGAKSNDSEQNPARVLSAGGGSSTKDEPDNQSSIVQQQPLSQQQKSPTNKLTQFLGQPANSSKDEIQPLVVESKPKTSSWTPTQKSAPSSTSSTEPEKKRSAVGWTPTQRSSIVSLPSEPQDVPSAPSIVEAVQDSDSKSPMVTVESEPNSEQTISPSRKSALSGFLAQLEPSTQLESSEDVEKLTSEEKQQPVVKEDAPSDKSEETTTKEETDAVAGKDEEPEQETITAENEVDHEAEGAVLESKDLDQNQEEDTIEDLKEQEKEAYPVQQEGEQQYVDGKTELRLDTSMNPDDDVDDDSDEEDYRTVRNIVHRRRTSPRDNKIAKAVAKLREQQHADVNRGMFVGGRGHRLGAIEEIEANDEEETEAQNEEADLDDQPVSEVATLKQAEENELEENEQQQVLEHHALSRPIVPTGQRRRPSRSSTDEFIEHIAQQGTIEPLEEGTEQQHTGSMDLHDETTTDETVELSRSAGLEVDQEYHSDEREPQDVVRQDENGTERDNIGQDELAVDENEGHDQPEEEQKEQVTEDYPNDDQTMLDEEQQGKYYEGQEQQVTDEYPAEDEQHGTEGDQAGLGEGQYEQEQLDGMQYEGEEDPVDHDDYEKHQEQQAVEDAGFGNEVSMETLEQALERVLNERDQLAFELDEERKTVAEAADLVKSMEIDQTNLQDRIVELEAIVAELDGSNPSTSNQGCEKCKTRDAADAKGSGLTKAALILAVAVIIQILLLAIGM